MSLENQTADLSLKNGKAKPAKQPKQNKQQPKNKSKGAIEGAAQVGVTIDKELDFPGWYQQVLTKGEMLEYYDVSGCYIMRPASFFVWEKITEFFNKRITDMGVRNAYFPMFVSSRVLEREKDHVEGFAPEVAWVTRAGSSDLEEPIAIRPTSETVMYPYYAKWIRSHRDLPLRLNQWNSVVRWEFKHPQPFLRTREFLWQEGHTAHLTKEGAVEEVDQILDWYADVYTDLLAVPVIKGQKTSKEKFAGSLFSRSIEGFIPTTGRGIQAATSHCLGQNFSKMFNIVVEDPSAPEGTEKGKLHVWQNSWGLSTRTIGVMVMVHSDNNGLVIPPRVAEVQVVVIPLGLDKKATPETIEQVTAACQKAEADLRAAGLRVTVDARDQQPGWKYADAELRGICLRLEIGPKDLAKGTALSVRRDNRAKAPLALDSLAVEVPKVLDQMHNDMYARAKELFDSHIKTVLTVEEMGPLLNERNVLLAPFCGEEECEDVIKDATARQNTEDVDERAPSMGAKTLCVPKDQPELKEGTKCAGCDRPAVAWTLFGRSY
ncbi:hypothetical protein B9G98_00816 [Wickerhamiella sorbophila]|uniref:proline--tRNA ligase n=1 Tax=Wickerhamiella sorbophila TaxID=45607 RepID=A0A2T0FDW2_9ASCO|nr:hypothetical protein B9G98_00816 [Wickerhamiella sorbophila]PRT53196.1 hypothetical protein B9G98_00816 [Wickerhamiella sorbophila]